jgi:hypothetical protein
MQDQTVGGSSDSPKSISEDGSFNEAGFLAALGKSRPTTTEETPLVAAAVEEPEETEEIQDEVLDETESQETEETDETVEESESEGESVLSQIDWEGADWDNFDWESLPKEVRIKLADKAGGSVGNVIGELRKKYGAEKAAREAAEAQLREGLEGISNTPAEFKELSTLDDLDTKSKEWKNSLQYANQLLVKTDEYFEINGEDVPRDQLAQWRDYYAGLIERVPEQKQRIRDLSGYSAKDVMDTVVADVPELADEESDTFKAWNKIVNDPKMAIIKQVAPKQYAEIQKMAAHSVAYKSKKKIPLSTKIPFKKPKNIGVRSNGAQSQSASGTPKHLVEAKKRIASGDYTEKDIAASLFGPGGAWAPTR